MAKAPTDWPGIIGALAVLVGAASAAYVSLRNRVEKVHTLVNSQLTEIKAALGAAVAKRDEAIVQRDEARQQRNHDQENRP
jgi:mitochondrial fission protein ELM1